jgi:Papain family cysteine protease
MLEALCEDGQPGEAGWPYLPATPADTSTWAPPAEVGALFGRNGQRSVHSLDRVTGELDRGRPVILLLMLSRAFYARHPRGVVDPDDNEMPEPQRRHAVVAVGHGAVDAQRAILVRNSWGPTWGDGGYGWLTERFLSPRIFAAATLLEEVDVSSRSTAA